MERPEGLPPCDFLVTSFGDWIDILPHRFSHAPPSDPRHGLKANRIFGLKLTKGYDAHLVLSVAVRRFGPFPFFSKYAILLYSSAWSRLLKFFHLSHSFSEEQAV